ncbi:DNA-(apurinic or apyrimidinic site) lyase [Achlya hypogyna]|uniref:DNA-(apurinic or apyrimidinic site) endonuclease n=1 Tax=Achlya hypogyna TaxID=1202772 RepID=A0A1V9ZMD1_ACHHY|nr:DNA-(apurinic or apyrimidinic site) lyase [Achlya hypogyna]
MKLLSWNINGLRANLAKTPGQSFDAFLRGCDADVLCFQETKLTRAEMSSDLACPDGYDAFYSFSRRKKGYSGVATFVRSAALATLEADTNLCTLQEGRLVQTVHREFVLLNTYCPAHGGNLARKMEFHTFLSAHVASVQAAHPDKPVVLVGDLNVIHKPIDDCGVFEETEGTVWLDQLLSEAGLVDSFRHVHPGASQAYTCWRALTSARETNYGVRIDYILLDGHLLPRLTACGLWPEKEGSDHCPVVATLAVADADAGPTTAAACAKFYPEFAGKQMRMQAFLGGKSSPRRPSPRAGKSAWQQQTFRAFLTAPPPTMILAPAEAGPTESIETIAEFQSVARSWKALLPGRPPPPPLCSGHKEPSLLRTVLKRNDNYGRKFYICAKPEGAPGDPKARCDFFQWAKRPAPVSESTAKRSRPNTES